MTSICAHENERSQRPHNQHPICILAITRREKHQDLQGEVNMDDQQKIEAPKYDLLSELPKHIPLTKAMCRRRAIFLRAFTSSFSTSSLARAVRGGEVQC